MIHKRPLVWRERGFRSRLRGPAVLIALAVFIVLDLVLVLQVMRDNVNPTARSPAGGASVAGEAPSLEQLSGALQGEGRTEVGAPTLSAKDLARLTRGASVQADARGPRETSTGETTASTAGSADTTGSGSSSSSTSSGGSSSGGSDSGSSGDSTGGSDSGGSDSGGSGGSDYGGGSGGGGAGL